MINIRDRDMKLIRNSRNLRGVLEHSKRHEVVRIDLWRHRHDAPDGSVQIGMEWDDGSSTIFEFASYAVACKWFAVRRRTRGWPEMVEH